MHPLILFNTPNNIILRTDFLISMLCLNQTEYIYIFYFFDILRIPWCYWKKDYLLSSSKSMVKAGHIGHDGSLIGLGGVDDICGMKRDEKSRWQTESKEKYSHIG